MQDAEAPVAPRPRLPSPGGVLVGTPARGGSPRVPGARTPRALACTNVAGHADLARAGARFLPTDDHARHSELGLCACALAPPCRAGKAPALCTRRDPSSRLRAAEEGHSSPRERGRCRRLDLAGLPSQTHDCVRSSRHRRLVRRRRPRREHFPRGTPPMQERTRTTRASRDLANRQGPSSANRYVGCPASPAEPRSPRTSRRDPTAPAAIAGVRGYGLARLLCGRAKL